VLRRHILLQPKCATITLIVDRQHLMPDTSLQPPNVCDKFLAMSA